MQGRKKEGNTGGKRERDTGEKERQRETEREREREEKEKFYYCKHKKIHGILSCRASLRRTE